MCSMISEKPHKGVSLSVKPDTIKYFNHREQNKDSVHVLSFGSWDTQKIFQIN